MDVLIETKTIVDEFHKLHYEGVVNCNTRYRGLPIFKSPLDLWVYQNIIFTTKPEVIIETGTFSGGSAIYLKDMMTLAGVEEPLVITIDKLENVMTRNLWEFGIKFFHGFSTDKNILTACKELCWNKKTMVILDSNHSKENVLSELEEYCGFVSHDQYLIVEDTNICNNPIYSDSHPKEGPLEAIKEWYPLHDKDFENDKTCEIFEFSFNKEGYFLRR